MKQLIIIIAFLLGSAFSALAQPENPVVEVRDGKKYYVHIVKPGNTLYGIHTLYQTDIETILAENEGLTDNLVIGQKVYIPIPVTENDYYGKHIVQQGETLYGISKKYKCSVADLKKLNADLSEGIAPGQEILVPKDVSETQPGEVIQSDPIVSEPVESYEVTLNDSIVKHTVLKHETMYSIAKRYMVSSDTIMALNNMNSVKVRKGDVLLIPVKKVNYEVVEKNLDQLIKTDSIPLPDHNLLLKEEYNVALLLPLMLDKNEQYMNKPLKVGQVREMYNTTKIAFDFYQGFLLAADSLTKAGLNVNLFIYDTKNDTNNIRKIFGESAFNNMDLVVGPLYRTNVNFTAQLCLERKIRIALPFNCDTKVLYQNPFVYKGVTSNMTLLDGAVDYLLKKHKDHPIVLIKPNSASDLALYERVRARYQERNEKEGLNIKFIETGLGSASGRELNNLMDSDTTNVVIIPSTDLSFVSGAMSRLNKVMNMNPYAKKFQIVAFGLEDWNKFTDMDIQYRNRMNQHYASYRFLDYNNAKTIEFVRSFRKNYGTDPNVFAAQGFDFGMYFLSALHLYGTNFDLAITDYQMDLIQNKFQFRKTDPLSGRENQGVRIVKYDHYHLVEMD